MMEANLLKMSLAMSAVLLLQAPAVTPAELTLSNERFQFRLRINPNQQLEYQLSSGTDIIFPWAPLGLVRRDADFSQGITFLRASEVGTIEVDYSLVHGKQRRV